MNSKYKKRGWYGESYRHYLASKGIKTAKYMKRKRPLGPHFAEKMLNTHFDAEEAQSFERVKEAYAERGFKSRKEYLQSLSDEYGVSEDVVFSLAGLLGPNEDFDGLVSSLQDYEDMGGDDQFFARKNPYSLSEYFQEVKGGGDDWSDDAATQTDYYALADQSVIATRDRFYAGKEKNGFLNDVSGDREVERIHSEELAEMDDQVSRLVREAKKNSGGLFSPGTLGPYEIEGVIRDWGRLKEEYPRMSATTFNDEFESKILKRLGGQDGEPVNQPMKPFGWAKDNKRIGKDKGANVGITNPAYYDGEVPY